jgi:uncharacterized protein with GYD domain
MDFYLNISSIIFSRKLLETLLNESVRASRFLIGINLNCSLVLVVAKSVQKYLLMIKLSPNMAAKIYEPLMEFSEKPMEGVKLEEAYQVFGEWDFAVLFQADTNANALHFVGDKIRLIDGVLETLTIPLAPIKEYRKQ